MLRRSLFRRAMGAAAAGAGGAPPSKPASFEDQYRTAGSGIKGGQGRTKTSLQLSLEAQRSGALVEMLLPFRDNGLNIHHVENRPRPYESTAKYQTVFVDVDAHIDDAAMQKTLATLRQTLPAVTVVGSWRVPWYPTEPAQLDWLDQNTLAAGEDLQDDPENPHPGFHDAEYRARRKVIADIAKQFRHGTRIPRMEYTQKETETWTALWDRLTALYPTHACKQYNYNFPLLVENAGFCRSAIPQLADVSDYLEGATGFTIRPVAGLLSSRDFFNALAFRVFFSTQYLRHHSQPFYTPEPDLTHEIIGHVPLFADPDFADFSQAIGLGSLGASDEMIEELGRVYWYSVEFGLCKQPGGVRAYGAGILSSFGELEYALSGKPQHLPFDPFVAAKTPFPITKFQPLYFVAEDFKDARVKVERWIEAQDKPFRVEFNPHTKKIVTWPKTTVSMLHDVPRN